MSSVKAIHRPCPDCGGSDCATVFEDGSIFCHSTCDPPFKPSKKPKKESRMNLEELEPTVKGYRGIDKDVAEFYGIITGQKDGVDKTRMYPYPHTTKVRILPKDFSQNAGFKNTKLFGMDKFNAGSSKTLTIVEGEDDVPSAYQMLGKSWPVVGAPGATSIRGLLKDKETYDFISAFKTIAVVPDNDEAGEKLADALVRAFPNKVYEVSLTKHKDSNEYLQAGDASEFMYAFHNRKKYVPDNILNTTDQFLKLFRDTPDQTYTPTGITELDDKIKGIMQGYFTVFKASTGIGKTELMRYIEHQMLKSGVPIATWHLEETKLRSLLGLVSYELDDNLTQKDLIESKGMVEQVEDAIAGLTKDELLYQFYLRDGDGTEELIEQIRYFTQVCGVNYIFIEPIQDIVAGRSEAGKEELLADLSVRLSKLCAELNIAIVTIAHTNDDGEIKYCRMIGQRAGIVVSLERDKDATDEDLQNTTYLKVEKNRPCSIEGYAGSMGFDPQKFTLKEKVF